MSGKSRVDMDSMLPGPHAAVRAPPAARKEAAPTPKGKPGRRGGKRKDETREAVFTLRLTDEERQELTSWARENGLSVSAAARFLIRRGVRGGA